MSDLVVSVILPVRGLGKDLRPAVESLIAALDASYRHFEVLLVDDGSTDGTGREATRLLEEFEGLRYIRLARCFGPEAAIEAGLDACIGDRIAVSEGGRISAPDLVRLLERVGADADIVIARGRGEREGLLKRLILRVARPRLGGDATRLFRSWAMSRQSLGFIARLRSQAPQLRLPAALLGNPFETLELADAARPRPALLIGGAAEAADLLVTQSLHPLRWVSRLSLAAGLLNFCYAGYILAIYIFKERVMEGWTTLSMQGAAFSFLLFLVLAVLCEYVGRLLSAMQGRAPYFIAEDRSSAVAIHNTRRLNVVRG